MQSSSFFHRTVLFRSPHAHFHRDNPYTRPEVSQPDVRMSSRPLNLPPPDSIGTSYCVYSHRSYSLWVRLSRSTTSPKLLELWLTFEEARYVPPRQISRVIGVRPCTRPPTLSTHLALQARTV